MGSGASMRTKRLMFWKAKLGEWLDNLTSEIDDPEMQMFGIETIQDIANKSDAHMEFYYELEGNARIIESCEKHKANELVVRAACRLWTFTMDHEGCAEQMRILKAKDLFEVLLKIHKYDSYVMEDANVCLTKLFMVCNRVGQKQIDVAFKANDVLKILEIMRNHPLKEDVQQVGLQAVAELTGPEHQDNIEKIKENAESAIHTMCYAMEEYCPNHRITLFGLNISCNLSVGAEGRSLCGKLGMTTRCIGAIHEFSGWGEREHKKHLEEEVRKRKAARANNEPRKRINLKNKIMGIEDPDEKKKRTTPFVLDLHICQIAIYNVANMIDGNPRNLDHYDELGFFKLLTWLIEKFHEMNYKPPIIIPLVVKRAYLKHQEELRESMRLEKLGIIQRRNEAEQEQYEDKLARRRQEYRPCIYAQTIGRGMCYRHCVECFAVDGVCDHHENKHDPVAEMLNSFKDAEK